MDEQVDLNSYLRAQSGGEDKKRGQAFAGGSARDTAAEAAGASSDAGGTAGPGAGAVPVPGDPLSRTEAVLTLEEWREACQDCRRCALRQGARGVVFGEGHPQAAIMFIGEGPGGDEDRLGRPFVGRAGQLLDRILQAAGLSRQEVYIANIVKCRPPGNRTPAKEEIDSCYPLLAKQINLIDPSILVSLGSVAAGKLIHPGAAITRVRGRWHKLEGRDVMPTFHPAALLRDPGKKKPVWEDIQQVMALLRRLQ